MLEGSEFRYCLHGTPPYMYCGKCYEQARLEKRENHSDEVFERLTSILAAIEARLGLLS